MLRFSFIEVERASSRAMISRNRYLRLSPARA
jgi:hypothetical protein